MFRQTPASGWVPNRSDRLQAPAGDAGCLYLQDRRRLHMLLLDEAVSIRSISCHIKCYSNFLFMPWRVSFSEKVFSYTYFFLLSHNFGLVLPLEFHLEKAG